MQSSSRLMKYILKKSDVCSLEIISITNQNLIAVCCISNGQRHDNLMVTYSITSQGVNSNEKYLSIPSNFPLQNISFGSSPTHFTLYNRTEIYLVEIMTFVVHKVPLLLYSSVEI